MCVTCSTDAADVTLSALHSSFDSRAYIVRKSARHRVVKKSIFIAGLLHAYRVVIFFTKIQTVTSVCLSVTASISSWWTIVSLFFLMPDADSWRPWIKFNYKHFAATIGDDEVGRHGDVDATPRLTVNWGLVCGLDTSIMARSDVDSLGAH